MQRRFFNVFLVGCGLVISAFLYAQESEESTVNFVGRVVYIPLEGGFYGIQADSGMKFDPLNLSKQFKRPGLLVKVNGTIKQVMTHRIWGQPIYINDIATISCKTTKREGCTP